MKYELISFDLQGTLSDSSFSDEFWLELLPRLYSEKHGLGTAVARDRLKEQFTAVGKYDRRYYCARTWLAELCPDCKFEEVIARLQRQPHLYPQCLDLLKDLSGKIPLVILSTTTHDFIKLELGSSRNYFQEVYSCLDDFDTAGKTKAVFEEVADKFGCKGSQCLHVGDCLEMDIKNAESAGWSTFYFDKKRPRTELIEELRCKIAL